MLQQIPTGQSFKSGLRTRPKARVSSSCLRHLAAASLRDAEGGASSPAAVWIAIASGRAAGDRAAAERVLVAHGIRTTIRDGECFVQVASQHPALSAIFAGTEWSRVHSGPGGALVPAWVPALRKTSGAQASETHFHCQKYRTTMLPAEALLRCLDQVDAEQ